MITDFNELTKLCREELNGREYDLKFQGDIIAEWDLLNDWMQSKGYHEFSEAVGYQYCDEQIGSHLIVEGMSQRTKRRLRAVRMLTSYQKGGDFEFRSPRVERVFKGPLGTAFQNYLNYIKDTRQLSESTIRNKTQYLFDLYVFLDGQELSLNDMDQDRMESFFRIKSYTEASRHNAGSVIKLFLQNAYDVGATDRDVSIYVPKDNYNRHSKIPTTYTEEEIRSAVESVDRTAPIGKRDYLVLLLAAEYGWRAKDITAFCFDEIDWDKNVIRFDQHKTGDAVEFPLLASVGNAIIDYVKHGRPESGSPYVILCSERSKWAKPLSSPTIHSIVSQYLCKARVPDWQTKKHGPHSFRHSLATNMLRKEVSLPVISTVMGHQTTATTKGYLKIDIEKLRMCPLPMPEIHSPHYQGKEVG